MSREFIIHGQRYYCERFIHRNMLNKSWDIRLDGLQIPFTEAEYGCNGKALEAATSRLQALYRGDMRELERCVPFSAEIVQEPTGTRIHLRYLYQTKKTVPHDNFKVLARSDLPAGTYPHSSELIQNLFTDKDFTTIASSWHKHLRLPVQAIGRPCMEPKVEAEEIPVLYATPAPTINPQHSLNF